MIKIDSKKSNFNKKLEIILNRRRKLDNSNTKIVSKIQMMSQISRAKKRTSLLLFVKFLCMRL